TGVRRFPPGSEWLYAKLYAGNSSVDQILAGLVAGVVSGFAGAFDLWFFLRYADPDWHLRLRFHGVPERVNGELRRALEAGASSLGCGRRLATSSGSSAVSSVSSTSDTASTDTSSKLCWIHLATKRVTSAPESRFSAAARSG